MNTYTLFFPNKLRAKLKIEVFGDGTIFRSLALDADSGEWISFAEELLNPKIKEAIEEDVAALRWEYEDQNGCLGIVREGLIPA